MILNYIKMHGLKNDFIIIDSRDKKISLNKNKLKKISNRKKGLGCDQIVFLEKSKNNKASAFIKFFNSDGSKTNACGNAARCVAHLLMKEEKKKKITMQTDASFLYAYLNKNNHITVDLGKAYFAWNKIPLKKKINYEKLHFNLNIISKPFLVNIGNPHIVFFVNNLKKINLKKIGPKIEKNSIFPEKINVNFAKIINNNQIKLKVWERGAGITKACGTGASATAIAAIKNKLVNKKFCNIFMAGGKLKIEYKKNKHVLITGPVKILKKGSVKNLI